MYGGDEVSALVIDFGSSTIKAGYAGEDTPKFVFPSAVGTIAREKENVVGAGPRGVGEEAAIQKNYYVGNNAITLRRDHMEIEYACHKGLVSNWEAASHLIEHTYSYGLRVDAKEHPVLLAEASFNTRPIREKFTELFFETHQVPALFVAKNAVLTAFASGRATALVVDSGSSGTTVVPVHDGYAITKSITKNPVGGELITQELSKELEKKGVVIKPSYKIAKTEVSRGVFEIQEKIFQIQQKLITNIWSSKLFKISKKQLVAFQTIRLKRNIT
eukprot:TRINITY_DN3923_c0_g1_i1.p1 TRINITY_DN3923_c0_g1~~TRINITY_DN3923_c0_g1_i1.p1  ORF type:complete len:282 (-),score=51.61 TRINITY_DN3923_c0_g1_i1:758-1579(-)